MYIEESKKYIFCSTEEIKLNAQISNSEVSNFSDSSNHLLLQDVTVKHRDNIYNCTAVG